MENFEDLAECLTSLFLVTLPILVAFYFTTNRDNKAVNIGSFIYYYKSPDNKDGTKRWICSKDKCSASVHINKEGTIVKMLKFY